MKDVIVVFLASHIPAFLFGLAAGLVIGLICVAVSSVRQYHKGLEDGYDRGRVQGQAAQHRIEISKPNCYPYGKGMCNVRTGPTSFECLEAGPDIMLHRMRAAQHEAEAR